MFGYSNIISRIIETKNQRIKTIKTQEIRYLNQEKSKRIKKLTRENSRNKSQKLIIFKKKLV